MNIRRKKFTIFVSSRAITLDFEEKKEERKQKD